MAVDRETRACVTACTAGERHFGTKFTASGAIGYATYLGGSSLEFGGGIAVDAQGNAYLTGSTESRNFPTTPGAFQTTRQSTFDAFVTKLNPTGTGLVYSTYLDGTNGFSEAFVVAVEALCRSFVTG